MELKTQTMSTKKILNIVYVCVAVGLTTKLGLTAREKYVDYELTRKKTICPALLSIGRSARDSLIIMRAENLCNLYVLETLK
jgi:hypothetical protein